MSWKAWSLNFRRLSTSRAWRRLDGTRDRGGRKSACSDPGGSWSRLTFVGSGFIFVGPYQHRLLNLHHHLLRGPPTTRAPSFPSLHLRKLLRHVLLLLATLLLLLHQEILHRILLRLSLTSLRSRAGHYRWPTMANDYCQLLVKEMVKSGNWFQKFFFFFFFFFLSS